MWGKLPEQLEMEERQWKTLRSKSAGKRGQLHCVTMNRKDAVGLYQMEEQPPEEGRRHMLSNTPGPDFWLVQGWPTCSVEVRMEELF